MKLSELLENESGGGGGRNDQMKRNEILFVSAEYQQNMHAIYHLDHIDFCSLAKTFC